MPLCSPVVLCIPYGGAIESAGDSSFYAGMGVLHHQTIGRGQADHFRGFQKYFGMRLGMGDAVAVRNGVKEASQADSIQDKGRIFAG